MKNIHKMLVASIITGALVGCGSDSKDDIGSSYLRVFHASPDAPEVNVWLDGKPALLGVDYQQSSGQIRVDAGNHRVQVDAILPDGSSLTVIPETNLDLMADIEYNVVAAGKAAQLGTDDVNAFTPKIVSRNALVPQGARVQAMHGAPDVPMVDIYITAVDADLTDVQPFANDISYLEVSEAVEVPAGSYQIRITSATNSSTVYFDSGAVQVPSGGDWFAVATYNTEAGVSPVNLLVDTGSDSLVVRDKYNGSNLRVVHTISDAPGVDVWVNGIAPAMGSPLDNLTFKGSTDYLAVPAGNYTFDVAVNGSDPVAVVGALSLDASLLAAVNYTALAIGNLDDAVDNDQLLVVTDDTRRLATAAKLRAIHTSTLAGNVDIYISADNTPSDDDVKLSNISYKGDSTMLQVSPGEVYVIVTPADDINTIAIGPALFNLTAGSITTLVAIDDPEALTGVSVISLDD
ncbi:DUF4397 domain-containing protein [Psychromonas antarctica]|uniref:DUF4397 domain-containing protein n=1 Tax=Psychromonas antarctica TaxID=67573 RepID=UPI001EE7FEDE|nr:DUF4397 domain-containing protein [Psychromonas antarctica]MCG6202620.1 DUF4397 domain-containing protein [Psychromonas antarctica]